MKNLYALFVFAFVFGQSRVGFGQFFEPLRGPKGITIGEMTVNTEGHIFITVPYQGILRSTDNGMTWGTFTNGISNFSNPGRILESASNGEVYLIYSGRFYRLPVGGNQWISKSVPGTLNYNAGISVNPFGKIYIGGHSGRIYAANSGTEPFEEILKIPGVSSYSKILSLGNNLNFALYNSLDKIVLFSDDGSSYEEIIIDLDNSEDMSNIYSHPDGSLLLIAENKIRKSEDGGYNWYPIDIIPFFDNERIWNSAVSPTGELYFLTNVGTYISPDFGLTIQKLAGFPFDFKYSQNSKIAFSESGYTYIQANDDFFYSTPDKGLTWINLDKNFSLPTTHMMYESPDNQLFVKTRRLNQMEKSEDLGKSWDVITINDNPIFRIAFHPNGDYFATTLDSVAKVFRSPNKGTSWTEITPTSNFELTHRVSVSPMGTVFLNDNDILMRSDNLGATWQNIPISNSYLQFPPTYHPSGDIYLNTGNGISRSSDDGLTWVSLIENIYPNRPAEFCPDGDVFIPVGTPNPVGSPFFKLIYLTNNGNTLNEFSLPFVGGGYTRIKCDCQNNVFASNGREVFKSSDKGENWELISSNVFELGHIEYLFIDSENHLYLGMLYHPPLRSIEPTCDFIDNVFESDENETQVNISPNPMSGFTFIQIENEVEKEYTLRLFDVIGKEIRIEKFNSNTHQFERKGLISGVYFYQIESQNQILKTGKLVMK